MRIDRRLGWGAALLGLFALAGLSEAFLRRHRPLPAEMRAARTVLVVNSLDEGRGSLREALFTAARSPERVRILIRTPRLELTSPLPPVVNQEGVVIDGGGTFEIDAAGIGAVPVLRIAAPRSVVSGLTIRNAAGMAISAGSDGVQMRELEITDSAVGIHVEGETAQVMIEDSVFSRNGIGLRVDPAGETVIAQNNRFDAHDRAGVWIVSDASRGAQDRLILRNNVFVGDRVGVVAINVPVTIESNQFSQARETAIYLTGRGTVRGNRARDGVFTGVFADATENAVIEGNELDHNTGVGLLMRSARETVLRDNRVHANGYGLAVVIDAPRGGNVVADNVILGNQQDGIYLVGASPLLRNNRSMENDGAGLRILDFLPRSGQRATSEPLLDNNVISSNLVDEPVRGVYRETTPDEDDGQ